MKSIVSVKRQSGGITIQIFIAAHNEPNIIMYMLSSSLHWGRILEIMEVTLLVSLCGMQA